ncbi:MAG: VCBS repeat-containing protein, partial [Verrucomicrobia bacterium]|nr:VCBS repeat-containing protein [Verrucomicrobiota bacterium]
MLPPPPNTPPTVSLTVPANGAIFNAPANVTLNATAADSDGTIAKVEFFVGTTLLATVVTTPYTFTWNNAPVGSHTLTVKATDNANAATTSTAVGITINAPVNVSPTVSLTAPANGAIFTAPANVTLDATAADSDGTITKVEFFQGTTLLATATASPYTFNWTGVAVGTYTLTVKATDNLGAMTVSSDVSFMVNSPPNVPPTVSLTTPANNATFTAPASITLSANSADSDGTIAKVEFFNGATLLATMLNVPYTFVWANASLGLHTLTAQATDNNGAVTVSPAIIITVNAPPNVPPTVNLTAPANGDTLTAPASLTLDATAADSDGSIVKVEFFDGAALLATVFTAPYTFVWNSASVGTHTLTARATDNANAATTSTVVNVTVNAPPNLPPVVSLTTPANNAVFTAPANIPLHAAASDSDGTIAKVEFFDGATLLATMLNAPYTFVWNNVPVGSHTLTAKATDNANAASSSTAVSLTVNAPPNLPPVVSLTTPANNAVFTAPANIPLNAAASDSDGTVSQVQFFQGTTLLGTDTTNPYSLAWNNVAAGTYSLTAKATDNLGAVTTSTAVTISVSPTINVPPTRVTKGDFNHDGKTDIVLQNTEGPVAFWLMNGTAITRGFVAYSLPPGWKIVGVGDFNGDAQPDIVLKHTDGSVAF